MGKRQGWEESKQGALQDPLQSPLSQGCCATKLPGFAICFLMTFSFMSTSRPAIQLVDIKALTPVENFISPFFQSFSPWLKSDSRGAVMSNREGGSTKQLSQEEFHG